MPRLPKPPTQYDSRFGELLKLVVKNIDTQTLALMLGVSESTIRNWTTPGVDGKTTVPPRQKIDQILNRLGLPSNIFEYNDEEWKAAATKIGASSIRSGLIEKPSWLYFPEDVGEKEKSIPLGSQVILITSDAYNDTHRKEVWDVVKNNIIRGVSYTYVIPEFCANKTALLRRIEILKQGRDNKGGSINVMTVKKNDQAETEWRWIDHVLFLMNDGVNLNKETIGKLEPSMIRMGLQQIYKADDRPTEGRDAVAGYIWIRTADRLEMLYCELLQAWAERSDWRSW